MPTDPEELRLWSGVSVYATEAQARRKARGVPTLGTFIAAIEIPDDGSVQYERTTKSSGHHTIWADAVVLLQYVVLPVSRV
jgi:hypothetical protein